MKSLALAALVAAGLLSACGHRGDLERPGPMWGRDTPPETQPEPEVREDPTEAPSERQHSPQ